jgi:hypothetical protein
MSFILVMSQLLNFTSHPYNYNADKGLIIKRLDKIRMEYHGLEQNLTSKGYGSTGTPLHSFGL